MRTLVVTRNVMDIAMGPSKDYVCSKQATSENQNVCRQDGFASIEVLPEDLTMLWQGVHAESLSRNQGEEQDSVLRKQG